MLKDWKNLKIGQKVHFYGKDFDGSWDDICTVIEIREDCVIVKMDENITLPIDDWSADLFRK